MLRAYTRRPHAREIGVAALAVVMLLLVGCVGRPAEVHGQHASFLPRAAPGSVPGAAPTNVGGRSDTSGLGAGMLVSPNGAVTPTATPTK